MKISIVTVCRNAAPLLQRTIGSVLSQTFRDFEFIVVDGASTDSTPSLLHTYAPQIDCLLSEPDDGIYDAMNKGVRLASGEWVIFMNAGDSFASGDTLAELAASAVEASADCDVIYGDVLKGDYSQEQPEETLRVAQPPHQSHRMIFCHQSSMTRRQALLGHPFDTAHRFSADFKLFKTLMHEGRGFRKVDYPVARFDTGGISNRRRSAGLADNMRVILEVDGPLRGLRHLLHLLPTYLIARLRGR